MSAKNLIISSVVGSLVYFLLGWVFYGMLFTNIYPPSDDQNMVFVYLGCLTFCVLVSYVFHFVSWYLMSFYSGPVSVIWLQEQKQEELLGCFMVPA